MQGGVTYNGSTLLSGGINVNTTGNIQALNVQITENGERTITPPEGVDGYAPITIDTNVPTPEPALDTLNVSSNGTYTPPSGVDGYDEVIVNVPTPEPVLDTLNVTQNGQYTPPSGVDGYDEVNVSISGYTIKTPSTTPTSIASFTDGTANPLKSLTASIVPVQDLHGYDSPWAGGAGKNKLNANASYTATANTTWLSDLPCVLPAGTYTFSYRASDSTTGAITFKLYDSNNNVIAESSGIGNAIRVFTFTISTTSDHLKSYSNSDQVFSELQIELGETATSYVPYSNICPISGWTACNVVRTGKNVFGGLPMAENIVEVGRNATLDTTNKTVTFTSSAPKDDSYERSISEGFKFKENTVYTFVATYSNSGNNGSLRFRSTTGTTQEIQLANTNGQKTKIAVTTWRDYSLKDIILSFYAASSTTLYYEESGIFEGDLTAEDFEPYNGQTTTIPFTDGQGQSVEVFGGSVDVVNGGGNAYKEYPSYNGETLTGPWISDRDVYAPNTTPTTGAQVVDMGDTTTFYTQPTSIKSLDGENIVFASTGQIEELEYFADL